MCPVKDGQRQSVMPLMVFPVLWFPPRQESLSQQPGLFWFELHWWCNSLKMTMHHWSLRVLLKAADYSVNQLWIISFLRIYVTVSMQDCTPNILIQPHCISSDPSWKVLQTIREDIYMYICIYLFLAFISWTIFQHLFFFNHINLSKAGGGMVGFPCFDGWRLKATPSKVWPIFRYPVRWGAVG